MPQSSVSNKLAMEKASNSTAVSAVRCVNGNIGWVRFTTSAFYANILVIQCELAGGNATILP